MLRASLLLSSAATAAAGCTVGYFGPKRCNYCLIIIIISSDALFFEKFSTFLEDSVGVVYGLGRLLINRL